MNQYLGMAIIGLLTLQSAHATITLTVSRDEMSSGFLFEAPSLRGGQEASSRNVNEVSAPLPFGVRGDRTYLSFPTFTPTSFTGTIAKATLRLETLERGFGLVSPSEEEPFQVSIHAFSQSPNEIDAMVTEGEQSLGYFEENYYGDVIDAMVTEGEQSLGYFEENYYGDVIDTQELTGFGIVEWDLTSVVNAWISGANAVFALAITGSDSVSADHAIGIYNSTWALLDGQQVPEIVIEEEAELSSYAQWKQATLGAVDGEDPDADGRSNLLEYALGSDPLQVDPDLMVAYKYGAWHLSEALDASPPNDVIVSIQYSLTLSGDDWQILASRQAGSAWEHGDVDDRLQARMSSHRAGFARVVVDFLNL